MIGSTPVAGEASWHPVHRANAMLRAALLSSARAAEPSFEVYGAGSLSHAAESVFRGPVSISFPRPLASRLEALAREQDDAFPAFETRMRDLRRDPQEIDAASSGVPPERDADIGLDLDRDMTPPHIHVQSLLEEFRWRQRQASILVAGSIVTAVLLTLGGLLLIASLAVQGPSPSSEYHSLPRSSSVVWQPPAQNATGMHAAVSINRAAKGEPLPVPDVSSAPSSPSLAQTQTILATSGRQIAFAPLLPPSRAGYFLIRGLPLAASFSAGRQSESGTWLIKAEHAGDLSLAMGEVAEGDYPIEIYVLHSGDQPQARRNLMLRVEAPSRTDQLAARGKAFASALLDVVPAASAAEAPTAVDAAAVRRRAQSLLDEGDIAAARLLLLYLAERGEGDAAYELARTFDREALDELGAKGIAADLNRARSWYERAAQSGSAKAAERLKILASLTETGPSD